MEETNRIELVEEPQKAIPQEENQPEEAFPVQEGSQTTQAGDPFEELLSAESNTYGTEQVVEEPKQAEQPAQSVEPDVNSEAPAKQDPNQHQYWQSQYDKVKGEYSNLKNKYQEMESLAPIARYIQDNPDVLNNVTQSLSKGNQAGQVQQEPQPEPLKRPEKPTRPAEYDAIDAYNDPNTDSYKYRDAMDNYRDNMIEYQEKRNGMMENALAQEAERQRQIMMKQQQTQQINNIKTQLTQGYQFAPEEADKFMKEMAKPESITMDNLVALWKMKQAPAGQVLENQRKADEMKRQRDKLSIPNTVGVAPAEAPTKASVEDRVMDALIDDFKSQNPF
mgnify:CR=1 FL=1